MVIPGPLHFVKSLSSVVSAVIVWPQLPWATSDAYASEAKPRVSEATMTKRPFELMAPNVGADHGRGIGASTEPG